MTTTESQYKVRQATGADLPALTSLRPPVALHKDRLRDADGRSLLYLVVEQTETIVGFGLLVFKRPATWSDADDSSRLPALVDLFISPGNRSRGAGSYLIATMEETARSRHCPQIYIGVDPVDNPRARQLYLRLGYTPLQAEPYRSHWQFIDSDGNLHEGNDWHIDMVKGLGQEMPNSRV